MDGWAEATHAMLIVAAALFLLAEGLRRATARRRRRQPYDVTGLVHAVNAGQGYWSATQAGSCCTCGHEWEPGEIIGTVTQEYELQDDGSVVRRPGIRLACSICVARTRVEGDLSLQWAREVGLR